MVTLGYGLSYINMFLWMCVITPLELLYERQWKELLLWGGVIGLLALFITMEKYFPEFPLCEDHSLFDSWHDCKLAMYYSSDSSRPRPFAP